MSLFSLKTMCNSVLYDSSKPHVWEKLVLQLWPKMLSANQIAVLFDHEYLWKESINLFSWGVEMEHWPKID